MPKLTLDWDTVQELYHCLRFQYISQEKYPLIHRMMREIYDLQNDIAGTKTGYHQGEVERERKTPARRKNDDRRRADQDLLQTKKRGQTSRPSNGKRLHHK